MTAKEPKAGDFLRQRGWTYEPEANGDCGAVGVGDSGWCPRIARWSKPGRQPMCATHARMREEWDGYHQAGR